MTSMKIVQFSSLRTPLSIYVRHSSTPFILEVQFQTYPFLLQMTTNQLKENMIQGWLFHNINNVTTELFIIFIYYYWRFLEWGVGQDICNGYDWIASSSSFSSHVIP